MEGAQSRVADEHCALHVTVVVLHDHTKVLPQERLGGARFNRRQILLILALVLAWSFRI